MHWHTIVTQGVSQAIGQCGLTRAGIVRVIAHLHGDLPARADRLRRRRDPDDPDLFLYRVTLLDGGRLHFWDFWVNDVNAQGFLFILRMKHFVQ